MAENLRNLLGDCFNNISALTVKKLQEQFSNYEDHVQALKQELTEFRASADSNKIQLNNDLNTANEKLKSETETCQQLRSQIKEQEETLVKLHKDIHDVQNSHRECGMRILELQATVKQLSNEKLSMAEVLGKKDEEIKTLEDNLKLTCTQLAAANTAKFDTLVKVQEMEIQYDNFKHQNNRLNQEKELLSEQVTTLNRELTEKSAEILRLSKDKSTRVLELQADLDLKTQELELAQSHLSDLRQTVKARDKRIESLDMRIKEVQDNQNRSEEQFTLEVNALTQLSQLHKSTAEESQSRVTELMKSVEEMHSSCKAAVQAREESELSLKECQVALEERTKEMEKHVEELKKQLSQAQETMAKMTVVSEEALEQMFPEAASSNRLLRKGMSLTEMYTTYRRSEEELLIQTNENLTLKKQIKELNEEFEEREPIIHMRMQELKKAMETITLLQEQLHTTSQYVDKLETERDDAVRLTGYHKREHLRMKQTADDLSRQVRFLLKEIEEAAGRHIPSSPDSKASLGDQTSTDTVISEHLVTFKNLQELQEQNQKLLAVSRELGQQLEEKDILLNQDKSGQLKDQLDSVLRELEELKEERKVQANIVESIVQQRDSLRAALLHSPNTSNRDNQSMRNSALSLSGGSGDGHLQESILECERVALQKAEAALKDLKDEFMTYKKESKVNATMLQDENNKLRDSLSEIRLQMAKANSMLEFTQSRLDQSKSNLEMERKELKLLRENSQKYSGSILQHQQSMAMLHKELRSAQEKVSHAEITIQSLKSERDQLKATEVRLLQEREAAKSQHNSQSKVMAHLQAVQNNLERLESEGQVRLANEIKFLKDERESLHRQLDKAHQDYVEAVKAWENKLSVSQTRLQEEQEKGIASREELVDSYATMHSLKMELADAQNKLKAAEEKLNKMEGSEGAGTRGMNVLRQQLNSTKLEIQNLQQKLNNAQQNASHFSGMVDDLNKQLKEAKETQAQSVQKLEASLTEKTIHNNNLMSQIKDMTEQHSVLSEELFRASNEKESQIQSLKEQLSKLKQSSQASDQQDAIIKQKEQQFQADRIEQDRTLKEAYEKYQRELVLHAEDSEALQSARNKTSMLEVKLAGAEEKCAHLEEMLEELRSAWGQQEESFKSEAQALKQKAIDTEAQCNALHQQLELMGSQLSALKSTPDWTLMTGDGQQQEAGMGHLQEVIRYLRKDKDIAVSQCTASQSEAKRLQMKLEHVEKKLKDAQQELLDERTQGQSRAASELEHKDILKKLEMMNLLHESNRCLREEKEAISKANTQLKEKLTSLQSEVSVLTKSTQEQSSQLEMLSVENTAVRGEIRKWQARAAALTEQSRRHDPQDFRRMEEENVSLKEELQKLRDGTSKQQHEVDRLTATVNELRTEVLSGRKASEMATAKDAAKQKELDKLKAEKDEINKTTLQVKKIARKYKMQYDELKAKHDALEASTNASEESRDAVSAAHNAALEQLRQELGQQADNRVKEAHEKGLAETSQLKEDLEKVTKAEELAKTQMAEKEERSRKIFLQAKKKIETLQGERDAAQKNVAEMTKEIKDLKSRVGNMEMLQDACLLKCSLLIASKENSRLSAQRSHLEARSAKLEKEVKLLREAKERVDKQLEEMAQRKQVARPSTTGGPVERASSTIQEPLTANIRPMTPPVVTSGSGVVGLRHTPHPTPTAARTTPTASIRPMAIGTSSGSTSGSSVVATPSSSSTSSSSATSSVASSSTGGHTTRMAAVPPTTANISSTEGEPVLVSTAHVLPTSSGVPQATVQPTPAVPALVMPLAAPTPPPSAVTEQAASSSADAGADDQRVSHLMEGDDDRCVASSSTSSSGPTVPSSGLSSAVASTSPQTQVVAPTLKRQREEEATSLANRDSESQPDTTGPSAPQLKRLRIAGEAQPQPQVHQQAHMERASVVTSGGGVFTSLPPQMERASSTVLAVTPDTVRDDATLVMPQPAPTSSVPTTSRQQDDMLPERPGVIVTPEPQPLVMAETPSGVSVSSQSLQQQISSQEELLEQENQQEAVEELEQTLQETRDDNETDEAVPKSSGQFSLDDNQEDPNKDFVEEDEFEGEPEEEEEEEDEEGMEEEGEAYDDVKMQEDTFSDEDDMAGEEGGSPVHADAEDMTETHSEDQIIDEADGEEESQMDAQETSTVPGDTVLVASSPSSTSCAVRVPSSVDVPSSSTTALSLGRAESTADVTLRTGTPTSFLQQQQPHRPPVLPRVPPRSERLPSSQTAGFEEGDDSIVPSTPTLSVPRRGDGFAEAISSPHIPHGRFVFNSSVEATPTQCFSQLASQGALGVDDTRMDLSQFDEGSGRSVPTTPLQVSPPADATAGDLPELSLHPQQSSVPLSSVMPSSSTSGSTVQQSVTEPVSSTQGIPTITVTGHEEPEEVSQSSSSSSSVSGVQDSQPIIEEPQAQDDMQAQSPSAPSESLTITEVVSTQEEKDGDKEAESVANTAEESPENPSTSSQGTTRRVTRRPIVWKPVDVSAVGQASPFPTPSTRGPSTRGATTRGPRGANRAFRSRASPGASGPQGRGTWSGRGWRGSGGPGPSQ